MSRFLRWPTKDPDEKLDYEVDWSDRLGVDTISSSTFSYTGAPDTTPLVLLTPTFDDTTAQVVIDDGTEGTVYRVLNRIVTTGGHTLDQTVLITCRSR